MTSWGTLSKGMHVLRSAVKSCKGNLFTTHGHLCLFCDNLLSRVCRELEEYDFRKKKVNLSSVVKRRRQITLLNIHCGQDGLCPITRPAAKRKSLTNQTVNISGASRCSREQAERPGANVCYPEFQSVQVQLAWLAVSLGFGGPQQSRETDRKRKLSSSRSLPLVFAAPLRATKPQRNRQLRRLVQVTSKIQPFCESKTEIEFVPIKTSIVCLRCLG